MARAAKFLVRKTAAQWAASNPILGLGTFGIEVTTNQIKIGDGATDWAGLHYAASPFDLQLGPTASTEQHAAEVWRLTNPVLGDQVVGYESDTHRGKIGDGITPWRSLAYINGREPVGIMLLETGAALLLEDGSLLLLAGGSVDGGTVYEFTTRIEILGGGGASLLAARTTSIQITGGAGAGLKSRTRITVQGGAGASLINTTAISIVGGAGAGLAGLGAYPMADQVADALGINVHLEYGGSVYDTGYATIVRPRLNELGTRHIRGGVGSGTSRTNAITRYQQLAAQGIKLLLTNSTYLADTAYMAAHLDYVEAVENRDEPDVTDNTPTDAWKAGLRSRHIAFWNAVRANSALDSLPVLPSPLNNPANLGWWAANFSDLEDYCDAGALQDRANNAGQGTIPESTTDGQGGGWTGAGYGWTNNQVETSYRAALGGSLPIWSSELGPRYDGANLSTEHQAAKAAVRHLLHRVLTLGRPRVYVYQLIENSGSEDFGLLTKAGTPRQPFHALRNLVSLFRDQGPEFQTRPLDYTLTVGAGSAWTSPALVDPAYLITRLPTRADDASYFFAAAANRVYDGRERTYTHTGSSAILISARNSHGPAVITGAKFVSTVSPSVTWKARKGDGQLDVGGIRLETDGLAIVEGIWMDRLMDGIRIQPSVYGTASHIVRHSYFRNMHDDIIENDSCSQVDVEDLLIDGCVVFYSERPGSSGTCPNPQKTTNIRRCIVEIKPQAYDTGVPIQNGNLFKLGPNTGPVNVTDCVFLVHQPRVGASETAANGKYFFPTSGTHSNNIICWMGTATYGAFPVDDDTPLPAGFTVVADDRTAFDAARAAWLAAHGSVDGDDFPWLHMPAAAPSTSDLETHVLQKRSGAWLIAMWRGAGDGSRKFLTTESARLDVTLDLATPVSRARRFEPTLAATLGDALKQRYLSPTSISFPVPDHPVIVELSPVYPTRSGLAWNSGLDPITDGSISEANTLATFRGRPLDCSTTFMGGGWYGTGKTWTDMTSDNLVVRAGGQIDTLINAGIRCVHAMPLCLEAERGDNAKRIYDDMQAVGSVYRDRYQQMADRIAARATTRARQELITIRLGWEANRGYPWSIDDCSAVDQPYWRAWWEAVAAIIRSTMPYVDITWSHLTGAGGLAIDDYRPADELFDVVGNDVYDGNFVGYWVDSDSNWNLFKGSYDPETGIVNGPQGYVDYARAIGKRLSVCEWGAYNRLYNKDTNPTPAPDGSNNSVFVTKMYELFQTNADIMAYENYFNGPVQHRIEPVVCQPLPRAAYLAAWTP